MENRFSNIRGWFRNLGVKSKLILILIVVAYITLLVISSISYTVGRKIINEEIDVQLDLTISSVIESINQLVFERQNDLQLFVADSTLNNPNAPAERKTEVLRNQLVKLGWYDNLHVTDTNGSVIATTNKNLLSQDFSDSEWYIETISSYRHVSDVTHLSNDNKQTVILSSVLANENNEVSGMIIAELSWRLIEAIMQQAPENLEVFLYDQKGDLIATNIINQEQELPNKSDFTEVSYQDTYFIKAIQSQGYQTFNGNGWELIAQIPQKIAYQPITTFTNYLAITIVVLSFIVYLLGTLFASSFVQPIKRLTAGVTQIAKGKLGHEIDVPAKDEFGYLANNFNSMSHSLLEKTTKLIEEKGKYKSILESADEGISLLNKQNQIIAFNKKFCQIFGLKAVKIINKPVQDVFKFLTEQQELGDNQRQFKKMAKMLKNNNSRKTGEYLITVNKPKNKILQVYTGPVLTETNKTLGRIWAFRDITKEYESEKSKNDFIRVASHKLRTPITAIKWQTQMLSGGGKKDKKTETMYQNMHQQIGKLNSLAKMLMTAAEIKNDKLELTKEKTDIVTLINQCILEAQASFPEVEITLKTRFKTAQHKIDKAKVQQVFSAIIANSYYYRQPNRKAKLAITLKTSKKSKKFEITFKDNGFGLDKDAQDHLFEKFYRSPSAIHAYPDGSGLNLYLAKIIVKSHGGKLTGQGKPNKGTEFTIII